MVRRTKTFRAKTSCCPGKGADFRIADLLKAQFSQGNINNPIFQARIARLKGSRGTKSAAERLKGFAAALPFQMAQAKVEKQFQVQQEKAESDFISNIQSAIDKQLSAFTIPTATAQQPIIIQTPMIESESQIKQTEQSPVSLIPLAIIGVILGAVLLG